MKQRLPGKPIRKAAAALAITAALFVPLALFGGTALARTGAAASEYEYPSASQYQYRVTLCHRTHSRKHQWVQITVSSKSVSAHLRHGDEVAPCTSTAAGQKHTGHEGHEGQGQSSTTTTTTTVTTSAPSIVQSPSHGEHGSGGDNGSSGHHGNGNGGHGNGGGQGGGDG